MAKVGKGNVAFIDDKSIKNLEGMVIDMLN